MLSSLNIAGHLFLKKCKECTYAVELNTFTIFYRARILIGKKPFFLSEFNLDKKFIQFIHLSLAKML